MVEKDEIRDKIIEASRHIFSKYGFRKTTMDEIAQAIGKGKSSIYYYFPGKEDIYKAVIEKEATIMHDAILKAVLETDNPIDKFKVYITVRMKAFRDMVNFYEAIKNELLNNLDFINKIRQKYDKEEMEFVDSFLKDGVKQGLFQIEDTDLTAIGLVTAMRGLELPLYRQINYRNYDEQVLHLLNVLFYGIVKRG
jgi:AcrR family transcriptional regulator